MKTTNIIKRVILVLMLVYPMLSFASDKVEIMVSGSGIDKKTAVNNALRSALEQSYGTFVSTSTKILNDKLDSDEIVSLSRGNIESYNVLTEEQLPNGHWYIVVKATVNVNKLVKYVHGEGASVEIDMNAFNAKVQMEELNRNAERKIIEDLITEIEAIDLWDYSLELDEPSLSGDKYVISGIVNVKCNANTIAIIDMMQDVFLALDMNNQQSNIIKGGVYYKYYRSDGSSGGGAVFPYPDEYKSKPIILRNKYNNGLLYYSYSSSSGLVEPIIIIRDYSDPSKSLFLNKIRFAISPIGITVAGNNCYVTDWKGRSEIENYNGRQYLYLYRHETIKTYVSMPKTLDNDFILHEIGDIVFRIHFKKELSREEALKIKNVTVQPL